MGNPVAHEGDDVVGVDTHTVLITTPGGTIPQDLPSRFKGGLSRDLASTVYVDNKSVALVGSGADNSPEHIPVGGQFQKTPSNKATVAEGSSKVFADNKGVARDGDPAECCNDPSDKNTGHIVASGTVRAG